MDSDRIYNMLPRMNNLTCLEVGGLSVKVGQLMMTMSGAGVPAMEQNRPVHLLPFLYRSESPGQPKKAAELLQQEGP